MIGQETLIKNLRTLTIDTFPRSSIIVGEQGMGKHTLVSVIQSEILKLPLVDLTDNISADIIDEIYCTANPTLYLIDLSKVTERMQNVILKFIEEPLKNAFIVSLVESKNQVLNTVLNRCQVIELANYSRDDLLNFIAKDELPQADKILKYLKSPGKILSTPLSNINEMEELCGKIATKLSTANFSNTLSISNKINFKDEYNKFDLSIFLSILEAELCSQWLETSNILYYKMYGLTREHRERLRDNRLNREIFFNHFITELWKLARQ